MTASRIDVPEALAAGVDYGDCFTVAAVSGASAGAWAHATLRGAEGPFSRVVWQGILGFELVAPGAAGTLVGWAIAQDSPERFVMEADGRLMAGRMVFDVDDSEVRWTTSLRFHGRIGSAVWAGVGFAHRWLAPRTLEGGRRRLLRSTDLPS
ncbi:hypothetical protein ACVW00_001033 [Marmoricola sp. URHA0025 HA25]